MYTPANENDERLNNLQKNAEENPNRLFIVIFDEAHYGVTSEKDDSTSTKKLPYEKLVSILARTACTHGYYIKKSRKTSVSFSSKSI